MLRFKVVHKPRVAVRSSPSTTATPTGLKLFDTEVEGVVIMEGGQQWLALHGGGYILIDGKCIGLGTLLAPLDAALQESSVPAVPTQAEALKAPTAAATSKQPKLLPARSFQVVHSPHVAARAEPARSAQAIMVLKHGALLRAQPLADEPNWVRLVQENGERVSTPCYALVDGSAIGFGMLLQPLEGGDVAPMLDTLIVRHEYALALRLELPPAFAAELSQAGAGHRIELVVRRGGTEGVRRVPVPDQSRWLRLHADKRAPTLPVLVCGLSAEEKLLVCACIVRDEPVLSDDPSHVAAPALSVQKASRWLACETCADPLVDIAANELDFAHRKSDMLGYLRGGCSTPGCACTQYLLKDATSVHHNSTDAFGCGRCGCAADAHANLGLRETREESPHASRHSAPAKAMATASTESAQAVEPTSPPPPPPPPPPMPADEAEIAREGLFRRFEAACAAAPPWPQLAPVRKLWAVSDIHVEHQENWAWLSELPPIFQDDGLIIAGDVCAGIGRLRDALTMLVPKFKHVFYITGNHELWLSPSEGFDDSLEKYLAILALCKEVGAHATPSIIRAGAADGGRSIAVCPLQSWYHSNFLDDTARDKALKWEEEMRRRFGPAPAVSRRSEAAW